MGWFSRSKIHKLTDARPNVSASSPQRPLKGTTSAAGCLICPACGGESAHKVSEIRTWMRDQELDAVGCGRCGTFLTPN